MLPAYKAEERYESQRLPKLSKGNSPNSANMAA